jgi:dynein light chain roadblock-type
MEACLQRLSSRDDIEAVTVVTMDGRILYKCDALNKWIPTLTPLCSFARDLVRDIDPEDNIQVLRLRTKNYEMIITIHAEQLLIVMQTLPNRDTLDSTANRVIEEDWEAFLQTLRQHTKKDDFLV